MVSKRTQELVQADKEHMVHPYFPVGQNSGLVFDKAHGVFLVDTEGKEYFDLSSQLVCVNLGHGQKEIREAVTEAINKTDYTTSYYGHSNPYVIECSRKLAEITPGDLNHFLFTCGGSESTDSGIKIARLYWNSQGLAGKYKIISLYNSYHGETGISTYVTGMGFGTVQNPFGPVTPGFIRVPHYYCYRCMLGLKYPECNMRCARYIEDMIIAEGADSIAAVIAEPEQGAGGMIDPPPEWWSIVREICTKHNILLIVDEVMSGFTRTGKMFAIEHYKVQPDLMLMAKGITSAYVPFGGVAIGKKVYEVLEGKILLHGMTYCGHPIPAAASCAALDLYKKLKVAENAARVGNHIKERLEREFLPLPCIGNVTGKGMFQAIELVSDKKTKTVINPDVKAEFIGKVFKNGLFSRITGLLANHFQVCPPCVATIEEVDKALDILLPLVAELKSK